MNKETMKEKTPSNILIFYPSTFPENTQFVRICEGTGDNLLPEDEAEGYVDYIMIDGYEWNGIEIVEGCDIDFIEGGMALLEELYQEKFSTATEVVDYLIECEWLPNEEYVILCAN